MKFPHFVRRLHLYLGLALLSWVAVYGVSSAVFAHPAWFDGFYQDGKPLWAARFDRTYDLPIPPGANLRDVGARIVADSGLSGSFGANRPNEYQVNVYVFTFWSATQIRYMVKEKRLIAEDRRFRWDHFLTGMHARGGFDQPSLLSKLWGAVVDVVCIGFLLWIASGLYMWWQLRSCRKWGWVALGGGFALFAVFLARL